MPKHNLQGVTGALDSDTISEPRSQNNRSRKILQNLFIQRILSQLCHNHSCLFLKINGFCGCNCVVMLVKANKDNPHHERIFKSKLLIGY